MPAVRCDQLSKTYSARPLGIKEMLVGRNREQTRFVRQWAIKDVGFEVPSGGSFGVIGSNGGGKSTLLGVLLGVLHPDEGLVDVRGRVAALLELGAGFHPELTGRQNLFLYGSILGIRTADIRRRLDAIVDFAQIGRAIDQPLRTYSSGMITRLGFATIAHADADVLLVDEVLAVGDLEFHEKCFAFFRGFKQRGGTLIVVSHDLEKVQSMCDRGLCLDEGRVRAAGSMAEVVAAYRSMTRERMAETRKAT